MLVAESVFKHSHFFGLVNPLWPLPLHHLGRVQRIWRKVERSFGIGSVSTGGRPAGQVKENRTLSQPLSLERVVGRSSPLLLHISPYCKIFISLAIWALNKWSNNICCKQNRQRMRHLLNFRVFLFPNDFYIYWLLPLTNSPRRILNDLTDFFIPSICEWNEPFLDVTILTKISANWSMRQVRGVSSQRLNNWKE